MQRNKRIQDGTSSMTYEANMRPMPLRPNFRLDDQLQHIPLSYHKRYVSERPDLTSKQDEHTRQSPNGTNFDSILVRSTNQQGLAPLDSAEGAQPLTQSDYPMRRKEKGRFMQPRFSEAIRSLKSMQSSKYARPDAVTSHIVKKRPAELSLDRLGKMPASPAPDSQPLGGRSTQFLFHLGLLDEESARKGKRQPSHGLLPNIRKYEADLPEGSFNFEREKIQRTQLSALVQESEEDQRVSRMKKKLK